MNAFIYIKNFFDNSNRGVWGKQEILLALDTLLDKYMNETTKKLQEEINQSVTDSLKKGKC